MDTEPIFLTLAEVLEIHKNQVENYGGQEGIRDISLLTSALAMPETTFHGQYLHNDLYEMAAAYAYHICMNHPFFPSLPPAARNLFEKRFLDFQKLFILISLLPFSI